LTHLDLFLLGPPRFERDGALIDIDTRKGIALLAYLAVTNTSHSRDALATLFWPDYDQKHARAALRSALWALNKALAGDWLVADRERVGLNPEASLWVDAQAFTDRLAQYQAQGQADIQVDIEACAASLPLLTEAVALYQADFLTGFTLRDSPDFDQWQFWQTETLRQQLAGALERLVYSHSSQQQFEPAIAYARRWLDLDPLQEIAHRQLMQLYISTGQRAAASRQ